ncbi:hypothetical protein KSX_43580 [Ktedonospora formicarum]|uniref:Uncharacterized protein n=1 Tax=Ktedonospora formicarum TaxID=2778364 RepID=A0A8J3MSJ7_9CHLR|nr:hypothetical protein KSX_43580 [Ktedonospora formicarum]
MHNLVYSPLFLQRSIRELTIQVIRCNPYNLSRERVIQAINPIHNNPLQGLAISPIRSSHYHLLLVSSHASQ